MAIVGAVVGAVVVVGRLEARQLEQGGRQDGGVAAGDLGVGDARGVAVLEQLAALEEAGVGSKR